VELDKGGEMVGGVLATVGDAELGDIKKAP
jgi:hypothetical protein